MASMFELPEAKRVKRSELFEDGESASETSSLDCSPAGNGPGKPPQASIHFDYDFVDAASMTQPSSHAPQGTGHPQKHDGDDHVDVDVDDDNGGDDDGFEFRLFASSSKSAPRPEADTTSAAGPRRGNVASATTRIKIRSPTAPGHGSEGRFTNPNRPLSYYFADAERMLLQSALSAVSGRDVLERSRCRWPGTSLPWRVISLPSHHASSSSSSVTPTNRTRPPPTTLRSTRSRPRPNKKRRILLRTRAGAVAAKADADREKRTRRNREKKVKRKEKEKEKKKKKTTQAEQAGKDGRGPVEIEIESSTGT